MSVALLIVSMVLGLMLFGCSKDEEKTETISKTEVAEAETDTEIATQKVADTDTELVKQTVAELEELYPDIDVDIDIVTQILADIDVDIEIDLETKTDADIMDSLGNVLKYKVSDLDYEGYENEVYNLSYFSEADLNDLVVYFHMLLSNTADFKCGLYEPEMGIGAGFRGELGGMTTVVQIDYNDDDEFYITAFSRPN